MTNEEQIELQERAVRESLGAAERLLDKALERIERGDLDADEIRATLKLVQDATCHLFNAGVYAGTAERLAEEA